MYDEITRTTIFDEFVQYRIASSAWSNTYQANLNAFERYCTQFFPDNQKLTQDMLNGWYAKKSTECRASTRSRTQVITTLIRYIQKHYNTNLNIPELPKKCKNNHIPHAFSHDELLSFFAECDRLVLTSSKGETALNALTISVIFRTLYSTGMRTTEARLLKTDDINFDEGTVSIVATKGNRQHFVALDPDVAAMMLKYHSIAERLHPNRKYFFYNKTATAPLSAHELRYQFEKRWKRVNVSHAIPYDFRHNYAIQNINHWISNGIEFHDKFLYLSKSMGHSHLESTKYYYSLTPGIANIMHDCSDDSFSSIVPEVINYEEENE